MGTLAKLGKAFFNALRLGADSTARAIDVGDVNKAQFAIEDREDELRRLYAAMADVLQQCNAFERQRDEQDSLATKLGTQAEQFMRDSDEEDAQRCIQRQLHAEEMRDDFAAKAKESRNQYDQMKEIYEDGTLELQQSKDNLQRLKASLEANKVQSHAVEAMQGIGGNKTGDALEQLGEAVKSEKDKTAALNEMADEHRRATGQDLEEKIDLITTNAAVTDRMAALRAKVQTDTAAPAAG